MFNSPRCYSSYRKFSRKESCVLLFSFADFSKKDLPFSCSILFHWRKAFLRTTTPFYCFICFFFFWKNSEKKSSVFCEKSSFFSSHFVFVHHASHSPLFFISVFAYSLGFLDLLLLELIFLLLHFLQFSLNNNNFSFLLFFFFFWKTFQISIFHAWVASWCPFAQTLLQITKNLFVHFLFLVHFFMSICFCMFVLLFSIFPSFVFSFVFSNIFFVLVLECFSLLVPFIDLFFFWKLCLVWTSFFSL